MRRIPRNLFSCETERTAERSRRSRERESSAVGVEGGRRHHLEPVPAALQRPHQAHRHRQHCRPLPDVSAGSFVSLVRGRVYRYSRYYGRNSIRATYLQARIFFVSRSLQPTAARASWRRDVLFARLLGMCVQ